MTYDATATVGSRAYDNLLGDLRTRLTAYFRYRLNGNYGEAEDLAQDTLIAIHVGRDSYDRRQPFLGWVFGIAKHKLIDHYRRRGRGVAVPVEDIEDLPGQDATCAIEARLDIGRALARLPERARALLKAVKLDELSDAEAAEKTGMSEGAVRVAVHRAIRILASQLHAEAEPAAS